MFDYPSNVFYLRYWAENKTLKISHEQLEALGRPERLYLQFSPMWMGFELVPLDTQDNIPANITLGEAYYRFVENERNSYMAITGSEDYHFDHGPIIKPTGSLMDNFLEAGLDPNIDYDIPGGIIPFDLNGREVPSLYFSLHDAVPCHDN